ncbi:MAG: hypothetical protein JWM78_218 [Verrucomicrobiaceae bacterium]|nr:hypothetical protein [Verrucomicrobiaceae bacterium]
MKALHEIFQRTFFGSEGFAMKVLQQKSHNESFRKEINLNPIYRNQNSDAVV